MKHYFFSATRTGGFLSCPGITLQPSLGLADPNVGTKPTATQPSMTWNNLLNGEACWLVHRQQVQAPWEILTQYTMTMLIMVTVCFPCIFFTKLTILLISRYTVINQSIGHISIWWTYKLWYWFYPKVEHFINISLNVHGISSKCDRYISGWNKVVYLLYQSTWHTYRQTASVAKSVILRKNNKLPQG